MGGSDERELRRARQELDSGLISYNAPASMSLGEEFQVTVRVQRGTATTSAPLLELPGSAEPTVAPLRVSAYMRADIGGAHFDVELIGEEEQPLPSDGIAEWAWRVVPLEPGAQTLRLTVYAVVDGHNVDTRVFDKPVEVAVVSTSWSERVLHWSGWNDLGVGLVLAAILGLTPLVRRRIKARSDSRQPEAAPEPPVTKIVLGGTADGAAEGTRPSDSSHPSPPAPVGSSG